MSEVREQQVEETKEQRKVREQAEFDTIPVERTFATVKLYLNEESMPVGTVEYRGERLKALGVSDELAHDCREITARTHQAIQRIVYSVGGARQFEALLKETFEELFGKDLFGGSDDDSKGERSGGEGSGSGEGLAQPAGSVSGNS